MADITLTDLINESPFFINDIVQKFGVLYYKVSNLVKYHSDLFELESVRENRPGRPANKITYVGDK